LGGEHERGADAGVELIDGGARGTVAGGRMICCGFRSVRGTRGRFKSWFFHRVDPADESYVYFRWPPRQPTEVIFHRPTLPSA
jgi:hypothetical protein